MRRSSQLLRVLFMTVLSVAAGRQALANLPPGADGCNYYQGYGASNRDNGQGVDIPACAPGGSGCYECCVSRTDGPGYYFCAETAGGDFCSTPQEWFPDWWPDPQPWIIGFGDPDLPPDALPVEDWGPGDDGTSNDLGAGGGGVYCTGGRCYYSYRAPRRYAVPPGPHRPYAG